VPQLKLVGLVGLAVESYLQLQLELADELVRDVLLGGAVVEELGEKGLELHAAPLLQLEQVPCQALLVFLETAGPRSLAEPLPEVYSVLAPHQPAPGRAHQ
jgi:hypothetical protein